MKTWQIVLIVVAAVLVLGGLWLMGSYNGLVSSQVTVDEKWGNVQTAYQLRADKIPNLVAIVKDYSDYEGSVLTEVTQARAAVGSSKNAAELQKAGVEMDSAIARLLAVAENYPNLKANENYLSLQDELAGTENRIKTERDIFNGAVKEYNIKVRSFPTSIVAGMFGFSQKEMFQATAGTENAPNVKTLLD